MWYKEKSTVWALKLDPVSNFSSPSQFRQITPSLWVLLSFSIKRARVITVQMKSHSEILLTQYLAPGGEYMWVSFPSACLWNNCLYKETVIYCIDYQQIFMKFWPWAFFWGVWEEHSKWGAKNKFKAQSWIVPGTSEEPQGRRER